MIPNVLSIAGSDPSGGAGIQADLKTFAAFGTYGCAVITGLTAQNTTGVTAVHAPPIDFVIEQLDTLRADVDIHAIKTGMLGSAELIRAVSRHLARAERVGLVVDPVMVAKSGHALLAPDAVSTLRRELLPQASLLTPNLPEGAALLEREPPRNVEDMKAMAKALLQLGSGAVLLKGGHLPGPESTDVYCASDRIEVLVAPRLDTPNTHGTGCTLSAAIAAALALGMPMFEAVETAKRYLTEAIRQSGALRVGRGHGPVHHGHRVAS